MNLTLAQPWFLALPLVYLLFIARLRAHRDEVPFPSLGLLSDVASSWRALVRAPLLNILLLGGIGLLSFAAARPQRSTTVDQSLKRRNIMLVVDVSKSMEAQDFPQAYGYVQRMEGVRVVVEAYVTARSSEFIGLVVFGERAYLQSPLTTDNALVAELVRSLEAGMAGDGTAIGDGLGVALKRLRDVEGDSKAIILLTDGANNAGSMSPVKAAQIARDLGIKIHAIGIGSGEASIRGKLQGGLAGLSVPAVADYDEKTLRAIASETQGVFFNARSLDELSKVYEEIDRLESSERLAPKRQLVEELFAPYALAGTIMVLAALVLGSTIFLRTP